MSGADHGSVRCYRETAGKFLPASAAASRVPLKAASQSQAASGGSGSTDVPPPRCPCEKLRARQVAGSAVVLQRREDEQQPLAGTVSMTGCDARLPSASLRRGSRPA